METDKCNKKTYKMTVEETNKLNKHKEEQNLSKKERKQTKVEMK
jgi:hypothetical protein